MHADGAPSADIALHRSIADSIRSAGCDVVLNFSAGDGGGRFNHEQRLGLIAAGGEIASFTPGSYNSGSRVYDNPPQYLPVALKKMQDAGVRPEIEILDTGFVGHVERLVAAGQLSAPFNCLLVFGVPGGMPAEPCFRY